MSFWEHAFIKKTFNPRTW